MMELQSHAVEENVEWEILLWASVEKQLVITLITWYSKLFYVYE